MPNARGPVVSAGGNRASSLATAHPLPVWRGADGAAFKGSRRVCLAGSITTEKHGTMRLRSQAQSRHNPKLSRSAKAQGPPASTSRSEAREGQNHLALRQDAEEAEEDAREEELRPKPCYPLPGAPTCMLSRGSDGSSPERSEIHSTRPTQVEVENCAPLAGVGWSSTASCCCCSGGFNHRVTREHPRCGAHRCREKPRATSPTACQRKATCHCWLECRFCVFCHRRPGAGIGTPKIPA